MSLSRLRQPLFSRAPSLLKVRLLPSSIPSTSASRGMIFAC
ncbi:hypothetical protein BVRB_015820 [Beta vulgaris subsp. vulgaris]|uniref:Uncharacterized protein n=1 Tax=Beta vulgaris subsp. vulgaris TaxID=3555 RepID=A0A0J8B4F0_BETVV|nr:hypothetical protein BVRB_015820 [Beta vulgaris subsp. vulgaris]